MPASKKYRKILVTGGAGFIGSHLVDALIEHGYGVRILDNLDPQIHPQRKKPEYLNKKAEFIKGDVTVKKDLAKALKNIDAVFHKAAAAGVGQSMYKISHYVKTNSLGTANLLDLLVNTKNKIKKIIIAASMSSYGEGCYKCEKCGIVQPPLREPAQTRQKKWDLYCPKCKRILKPIPTPEDARQNPNSIYAISKKNQEEMIMTVCEAYGIPAVSLRYFNAYGSRQSLSNPYNGLVAIFLSRIKNNHQPIIYEDGLQTRDFVHIKDLVRANILALQKDEANFQTFNIGSGKPLKIKDVALITAKICQKNITPQILYQARKKEMRHCYADIKKAKKILKWEPKIKFQAGLLDVIKWGESEKSVDLYDQAHKELQKRKLV